MGAGNAKIASILGCTPTQAKAAVDSFLSSLPELNNLKKVQVKKDATKGYFIGLDGRRVNCDSDHLMLAGYLQNGEAVIMKNATIRWVRQLNKELIDFKLVNFVHDEWQVQVKGGDKEADRAGKIIAQSIKDVGEQLGLFCPLAGKYKKGLNWLDTH